MTDYSAELANELRKFAAQFECEMPSPGHGLMTDAADLITKQAAHAATLHAALEERVKALAECYRLSGADPDGNEDWRLADGAVNAVRDLRAELSGLLAEIDVLEHANDRWKRDAEQLRAEVTTLREALKALQQRQQKQDRVFRVGLAALEFIAGQLSQEDLERVVLREHAERQGIQ